MSDSFLLKRSNRFVAQQSAQVLQGGKVYFEKLYQLIDQAQHRIHLQCYIFDESSTGLEVAQHLIAAARRGVSVYLMVDGYASRSLSQGFIRVLTEAGVRVQFFEPLFRGDTFYFGRRLHHKVLVTDRFNVLVGGINVSEKYNDTATHRAWLDFALLAQGSVGKTLDDYCGRIWNGKLIRKEKFDLLGQLSLQVPRHERSVNCLIRVRRNDWVYGRHEISASYRTIFRQSRQELLILCSYFLPGVFMQRHLLKARKRGVRVCIILAGPSDVPMSKHAERYLYDWMLRNGIEVYEYRRSVLHGKVAVADGYRMTIGSYNVNNISAHASIELNLDVMHHETAGTMRSTLHHIMQTDCVQITYQEHLHRTHFWNQLIRWTSYQIVRVIIYLSTFYFKPRN